MLELGWAKQETVTEAGTVAIQPKFAWLKCKKVAGVATNETASTPIAH